MVQHIDSQFTFLMLILYPLAIHGEGVPAKRARVRSKN